MSNTDDFDDLSLMPELDDVTDGLQQEPFLEILDVLFEPCAEMAQTLVPSPDLFDDPDAEQDMEDSLDANVLRLASEPLEGWGGLSSTHDHAAPVVSSMTYYMNLINRFHVPTAEEERHYASLAKKGDRTAFEWMVKHNLRLVIGQARHSHAVSGIEMIDLISAGYFGLHRAVEKFDADRGHRFSTYAMPWIRQALFRAVSNDRDTIRCPYHVMLKAWRLNRLERESKKQLSREEICHSLQITDNAFDDIMFYKTQHHSCFDEPSVTDHQGQLKSYAELLTEDGLSVEQSVHHEHHQKVTETLLTRLNQQQLAVIIMRYDFDGAGHRTLEEIGETLNLSKQRVRQIEVAALQKMRSSASCLRIYREDVL